jgi:hypothetical protein
LIRLEPAHPYILSDSLKFVSNFRPTLFANGANIQRLQQVFPLLLGLLSNSEFIIRTYAAHTIERYSYNLVYSSLMAMFRLLYMCYKEKQQAFVDNVGSQADKIIGAFARMALRKPDPTG